MASAISTCSDNLIANLGPRADANSPQARNQTIAGRLFFHLGMAYATGFFLGIILIAQPALADARPDRAGYFLSTVPSYASSIQGPVRPLSESPLSAEAISRRAGLLSDFRFGMAYARGWLTPYLLCLRMAYARGIHPAYWQGCEHSPP